MESHSSLDQIAVPFAHTALSDPDSEIRLVTLLPNKDFSADIECRVSLGLSQPVPEYEALSYAWGDPTVLLPITLNSQVTHIAENLERALRSLRSRDQERVLWADAICINQQDDAEKSKQVLRMDQIYADAFRVLVWLGDADENVRLGLIVLVRYLILEAKLGTKFTNRSWGTFRAAWVKKQLRGSWCAFWPALCNTPLARKRLRLADGRLNVQGFLGRKALLGLDKLFCRPWWSRLWVAQEYLLGQSVKFIIGSYSVDSEIMDRGIIGLALMFGFGRQSRSILSESDNSVQFRQVTSLVLLRTRMQSRNANLWESISELLHAMKRATCTDPRDRVFAVLGLTSDPLAELNAPDYCLSVTEVYQRFARTWISERRNLDVLSHCQRDEEGQKLPDLPSWAPDCDHPVYNTLISDHKNLSSPNFAVSLQSGVEVLYSIQTADCLALAGFSVDIICTLGICMPRGHQNAIPTGEVMQQWKNLAQKVSSEPLQFWLTRITDRRHNVRLTDSERQSFCDAISQGIPSDTGQYHEPNLWFEGPEQEIYWWTHRRFFITKDGRMGMAHFDIEEDDLICILFGGQVPFVLRKSGPERYTFISECYIYGIMDGEAMKEYQQGRYTRQWFHLY